MKECPVCRRCFADDVNHCPYDGDATTFSIVGEPVLDSRYQLEKRLGHGGMGVVFKARHIFLKTQHAIKVILPDLVGNDPMLATRFRQEALAAASIRHQNVIAVTDFGIARGTMPFLVMEFVQGTSLHDLLAAEHAVSPERALELMSAVGAGVGAAHRQGIVHRDLKPLNIMMQEGIPISEGLKILDFGLAKIKSGELLGSFVQAKTSGLMGSPFYMAPEQWSDEEPDVRADIYSLGVILYQMLAGDVPFKGASIPSIMKKHLTESPPVFSQFGIQIPPAIEAVVRHTLEKEPSTRPQTVDEFVRELREAVASMSVSLNKTLIHHAPVPPQPTHSRLEGTISDGSIGRDTRQHSQGALEAAKLRAQAEAIEASMRADEESDRLRLEAEASRQRADEEAEARVRAEQEAARIRAAEDEARRQADAEVLKQTEEERQRLLAEAEAANRRAIEEATARRRAEEEAAGRKLLEEVAAKKRAEEEERQRVAAAEALRLIEDERKRREAEERKRHEIEEQLRLAILQREEAERSAAAAAQHLSQSGTISATPINLQSTQDQPPGFTTQSVGVASNPTIEQQMRWQQSQPSFQQSAAGFPVPAKKSSAMPLVLGAIFVAILVLGGGGFAVYKFVLSPGPTVVEDNNVPPKKDTRPTPPVIKTLAEMIQIPGGTFMMGTEEGPFQQTPSHSVTVKSFWMDKTEVTREQYALFLEETKYPAPATNDWVDNKPLAGQERWPVVNVSIEDAKAFAEWRSKRDGVQYRLPTEEEWEYAARGGDQEWAFPWGDEWSEKKTLIGEMQSPSDVGSLPDGKNRWGVVDLIGNVWEWTSTKVTFYPGNDNKVRPESADWHIYRGFSFASKISDTKKPISSSFRDWVAPATKNPTLGFRLVKDAP